MNRIQRISQFLLVIFNILIIGLPLSFALLWFVIDTDAVRAFIARGMLLSPVVSPEGVVNLSTVNWTPLSKLLGFMSHSMAWLPLFIGLFSLKTIFKNYQNGNIFITENARLYKRLGLLFFLDALFAQPLSGLLMTLGVTLSNPPGHRYITLSFGALNIEAIFFGILVMVIAWVMLEGSRIQEEQQLTV